MHEFQLSGRVLVSATVALALAAGTVYLSGLLVGLRLSSTGAAAAAPTGPQRNARVADLPGPADRLRAEIAAAIEVDQAGVIAAREGGADRAAPPPPPALGLAGLGPSLIPVGRRHRSFESHDPWFRLSDPVPLTPFGELIYRVSRRHRMSPQFVAAVVWAESAFDPGAVSSKGARGLLQVMPATARRFGTGAERLFEPEANLDVGVRYLRFLSERYAGDVLLVLAAYNAGEATVDGYRDVPPYPETRDFIRRVAGLLEYRRPASGPFD